MERAQLSRTPTLRKPVVKHHPARAITPTVRSRSVGLTLEGEARDFTQSCHHVDLANVRVRSDDQAAPFAAALNAPPSLTWGGNSSAFARTPNETLPTAPTASRNLAESPGEKKKPECAVFQAGGEVPEPCPGCANPAEHASRPLQTSEDDRIWSGGPEPDKDEPAQCKPCAIAETVGEILEIPGNGARQTGWATSSDTGVRPMEAGWWTSRTPTSNTVGCDGSGSLVVMQNGPTYLHGVTDCTIEHEQVHVNDWLVRYGSGICTGRARGDLPYYDPPGKDAYASFLKKSECGAWLVGHTCRKGKLAACKSDACKEYVQEHVDFAGKMVKKYCGLSAGAKAAIGALGGAVVGAGVGALTGGPVGALVGGGIGAVVGGLGSLLF
jgi:hypothetical protein